MSSIAGAPGLQSDPAARETVVPPSKKGFFSQVTQDIRDKLEKPEQRQVRETQEKRRYEAQFFALNLPGKLDYKKLAAVGISKIIVSVFQDGSRGGLYFGNTIFRTIDPALEKVALEMAAGGARRNLDLCAWMITRKFRWVSYTRLFDYCYRKGRRELIRKFDIFNPDAIEKITAVYRELARKDIDCILIQDDFFIRHNEGFSNWGKAAFAASAGFPARESLMVQKNTPYNRKWKEVKRKQVSRVLTQIVGSCKQAKPGIKVGMNIYYETPFNSSWGEAWYAHNLPEIVETGIDYIYLMSYHRQIKEEMKLTESKNREMFRKIVENAYALCKEKLVVKLQLRDWNSGRRIPAAEVRAYLALVPEGVKRICFTPVKPGDYAYLKELIQARGAPTL